MFTRNSNPEGNWISAHISKWNFLAAGKTREDIAEAHQTGVDNGDIKDRPAILGKLGTIGYSIHETPRWLLKGAEIFNKVVGTIMPAVVGWEFCKKAVELISESNNAGDAGLGAVMGIVGLAAISIGPIVGYQTGAAYGKLHRWMKDNDMESGFIGSNMRRGR